MDYLLVLLQSALEDDRLVRTAFVSMITVAFFGCGIALTLIFSGMSSPLRRRLSIRNKPEPKQAAAADKLVKGIAPISHYVLPHDEKEQSRVRAHLVHAGFRGQDALTVFYGIKFLMAISFPAAVLLAAPMFPTLEMSSIIMLTMSAAAVGVMGPNVYLRHKVEKRQKALRHGFPDALDLLVVCVEAGLGLSTAIQRVAEEVAVSHPELADDLMLVTTEVRAGIDNVSALKNLAARTGLEDIRGLVSLLSQSLRFGTSVADTLRVYSEEFRDRRMQAAEEQAAKIGTKLIFPLVTCLFPGFFVVAVGPAILKVLAAVGRI